MIKENGRNSGGVPTEALLREAYDLERRRLLMLAERDEPQGEYRFPVFGEGNVSAHAMLIGEAPGAEETKQQRPFVGRAGKQLDELIAIFGVSREELYISNTVKYRPVIRSLTSARNRTPLPKELAAALPLLRREIELIGPRVILTLGNTPLKAVCQIAGVAAPTIGGAHGKEQPLKIGACSARLIPLYHPASGIYNRSLIEVMERDALFAGSAIRGTR